MNKENRKAARERRAKEREHEAKVAHYKKIWSWAGLKSEKYAETT